MKKLMVVAGMVAVLAFGTLTGCGKAEQGNVSAPSPTPSQTQEAQTKTYSNEEILNAMAAIGYSTESNEEAGTVQTDVKGDFSSLEKGLKSEVIKAVTAQAVTEAKKNYTTAKEYKVTVYQGADKVLYETTAK